MVGGINTRYPNLLKFINSDQFWCPYLYNHLAILPTGNYSVCCRAKPFDISVENMSFNSYVNSREVVRIRKEMESGYFDSGYTRTSCQKCFDYEQMNVHSMRQRLIEKIRHRLQMTQNDLCLDYLEYNLTKSLGNIPLSLDEMYFDLVDLQIFGNLCNLKCVMCSSQASSLYSENAHNPYETLSDSAKKRFLQELDVVLSRTNSLKVIGGEITVNKSCLDFLEGVSKDSVKRRIHFQTTTNGTVVSDRWLQILSNFRSVRVGISIDAYGEINDLQRRNSRFSEIDRNVDKYRSIFKPHMLEIISATTNLTCSRLEQLYLYILTKKMNPVIDCVVLRPEHLSIKYLPDHIRQLYLEKLQKSPYTEQFSSHINTLRHGEFDNQHFQNFITLLQNEFDVSRIVKNYPEYKPYLE